MIHRKAMSLMSTAEAIAATAAAALSQATSQQTSPTGSTVTHNADGTKTISGSVLGTDSTGTSVTTATHVGDTTPPGVPTGITAWSGDGAVHVSWDGTLEGGIPAGVQGGRMVRPGRSQAVRPAFLRHDNLDAVVGQAGEGLRRFGVNGHHRARADRTHEPEHL